MLSAPVDDLYFLRDDVVRDRGRPIGDAILLLLVFRRY